MTGRPFSNLYHTAVDMALILLVIPVLVGVFVGAPLLARELETGTFRFATPAISMAASKPRDKQTLRPLSRWTTR